jgi:tetratricopeptide (TPR) repeat protein
MRKSLTMTCLRENAMKVFVWLFALLMLASAAPAMACSPSPAVYWPETYEKDLRVFVGKTVQELGAQDTPDARLKLAEALFAESQRADAGACNFSPGKEIAFSDEIERRFGNDPSPRIRAIVLKALIAKTNIALHYGRQVPEGNDASSLIKHRYATDSDPEIQALYAGELVSMVKREHVYRPFSLPDEKREQVISLYDGIFARHQDSKNPGVRAAVAKALLNKAELTRNMEERLFEYDKIVWHFSKDDSPKVREEVINALLEKGDVLQRLGKYDEAVSHYDNFMQRPAWAGEWVKFHQRELLLALILLEKGKALEKQGKLEQAVATYDQAIAVYDAEMIQGQWVEDEHLLTRICRVLIAKAAILGKQKGEQAAHAIYENMVKRIEESKNRWEEIISTELVRGVQFLICGYPNTLGADVLDACIYVFQRIGLDDYRIQADVQKAIKRKAQQKP